MSVKTKTQGKECPDCGSVSIKQRTQKGVKKPYRCKSCNKKLRYEELADLTVEMSVVEDIRNVLSFPDRRTYHTEVCQWIEGKVNQAIEINIDDIPEEWELCTYCSDDRIQGSLSEIGQKAIEADPDDI
jgi:predicted RNA-binding Zn-ribbon protein involved in translation (DUF1610 family)